MSIAIVFIHTGDDEYLDYSIRQAKFSNPSSSIFLLGDQESHKYASNIAHYLPLDHFFDGANEFAGVYQHLSPNTYPYELFCFQRWFVLRDFMRAYGIEQCCYLDSDIMLCTDIDDPAYRRFTNIWTMLSFNTRHTLENFCSLMLDYYHDPALLERLKELTVQETFPGVSDMVFSKLFVLHYPEFGEHQNGIFQDSFFDGNLRHPMRFPSSTDQEEIEMLDGNKRVYFIQGRYYAKLASGKYVRINGLHFQGDNKAYMRYFYWHDLLAGYGQQTLYFDYRTCEWVPA